MDIPKKAHFIVLYGISLLVVSFIDNIVMSNFLYSILERHSIFNLVMFISIALVSVAGQGIIFYLVRKEYSSFQIFKTKSSVLFQSLMILSICLNVALFSYLIFQLISSDTYDTWIFKAIIFSNYSFSLINLGFLIYSLFMWYKTNLSIIMLIYFLAFSVYLVNEICSILGTDCSSI